MTFFCSAFAVFWLLAFVLVFVFVCLRLCVCVFVCLCVYAFVFVCLCVGVRREYSRINPGFPFGLRSVPQPLRRSHQPMGDPAQVLTRAIALLSDAVAADNLENYQQFTQISQGTQTAHT